MPEISVIIPCYNCEKYVAECLDSVLAQTFEDWEAIVVNDGSTDGSAEILEKYQEKDSRIKVIAQKNQGVITARCNAIKHAKGEFIYTLDSDDIIEKTALNKLYKAIIAGKGDVITCRVWCFGIANEEMRLPYPTKMNMAKGNCLVNAALMRKSLYEKSGGFDYAFNSGLEDYDLWLNMIYRQGARFYRIPEILFFYRIKPSSESRNKQQEEHCNSELMAALYAKYPEMKYYRRLLHAISFFFQVRRKNLKTIIRVLKFPIFVVRYKTNYDLYLLFNFIPVFWQRNSTILCYFFNTVPNFGDLLNNNLFSMFGKKITPATIGNSEVMAIGSLLQTLFREKKLSIKRKILIKLKKPLIVYGSGFIEDMPENFQLLRRLDVRAVRGYLSLEKLKKFKNVSISQNVVIGDPGLLSKYIIDTSNVKKKYDLGIVPHYVDKDNILLNKIKVRKSVIIDIQQAPEIFLKQIAECKNVISSAMHGLIAADSLGIPNVRMVLSDKITGKDYKYNDYYSAFCLKSHNVINLNEQNFTDKDLKDISKNYHISSEQVEKICQDLIAAFPYKDEK